MLINLRNALMAGKRLPYDAEVEYLKSTGTQWIDTGIANSNDLEIYVKAKVPTFQDSANIFGVTGTAGQTTSQRLVMAREGSSKYWIILQRAQYGYDGRNHIAWDSDWHEYWLSKSTAKIDLSQKASANIASNTSETIYLFAINSGGDLRGQCACLISRFIISNNGTLVRDFIPVRKGTVGYLYDRVTRKLFGNAGTGDFVLGPDVVPVEYIESHGTEWIDTGVSATNSIRFDARIAWTATRSGDSIIFGNYTTNGASIIGINANNYYSWHGSGTGWTPTTMSIGRVDEVSYIDSVIGGRTIKLNGMTFTNSGSTTGLRNSRYALFRLSSEGASISFANAKLFSCQIYSDGTFARSFRPVRVGTDATSWEGAMMDVLTRRIYRNAGTGAFSYGNDLKYPIPAE